MPASILAQQRVAVKHSTPPATPPADSLTTSGDLEATEPTQNNQVIDKKACVFQEDRGEWIDGVRESAHSGLCKSVLWVDGLFGDEHQFDDKKFSAKLSLGFRHDETEGFDPRLRVRIKSKLPNVSDRLNAFIGRVEEDSYISNTEVQRDQVTTVGLPSAGDDDNEWLIGIGYRNPNAKSNGFDFSVGAKLSSGLNPYAKIAHRYLFPSGETKFWKTTQTAFWRKDDGFGFSSSLDYTQLLTERDIFQWETSAKFTEESDQWEWVSGTALHHSFNEKQGISSRAYIRGEQATEAEIPEFGVTFTYVQPFLRPWLFVQTGVDFRWEKFDGSDQYKNAVRFGLQFEMVLGDYHARLLQDYRD